MTLRLVIFFKDINSEETYRCFLTKFCNNKVPSMETLLCNIKIQKNVVFRLTSLYLEIFVSGKAFFLGLGGVGFEGKTVLFSVGGSSSLESINWGLELEVFRVRLLRALRVLRVLLRLLVRRCLFVRDGTEVMEAGGLPCNGLRGLEISNKVVLSSKIVLSPINKH